MIGKCAFGANLNIIQKDKISEPKIMTATKAQIKAFMCTDLSTTIFWHIFFNFPSLFFYFPDYPVETFECESS